LFTKHSRYALCGTCATAYQKGAECPACGSHVRLDVVDGYVTEFPAGTMPCAFCGGAAEPLRLRGWSYFVALLWWWRETRKGGYVCSACARTETAKALLFTALLGWLSVPSWLFYGWRSTYLNWRSVWAPPRRPSEWGATSVSEYFGTTQDATDAEDSPLGRLNGAQQRLVIGADDPYEALGVHRNATADQIKAAYRRRCKAVHPDLRVGATSATDEMIRLNQAWEILRDPATRQAYDWLDANLAAAV
jgi:hypothetical protein